MAARRNLSGLDVVAGVGARPRVILGSDQPTNTTVMGNVTGLAVAAEANAKYIYDCFIIYSGSTTADLAWSHTVPASAQLQWGDDTNFYANAATSVDNWSSVGVGIANARSFALHGMLTVAGTAGNLQARFAQQVLDAANNTVIHAGSWMRLDRVS